MNAVIQELFSPGLYKRTQGRVARQVTFAVLAIATALGCWQMHQQWADQPYWFQYVIPGTLLLFGIWVSYRVVNVPRFADFLIAVEAEMNKVSWPSRRELFRSSVVVLVCIFFLAAMLFLYDAFWQWLLWQVLDIGG